jgi:hypothetical protein
VSQRAGVDSLNAYIKGVDWSGVEIDWNDGKGEYRHHTNMEDIWPEKGSFRRPVKSKNYRFGLEAKIMR